MGYERLSHTADLRFRIWGRDYEELFRSAFLSMMSVLKRDIPSSKDRIARRLKLNSQDVTNLLVDFLNEVLYNSQVNREIYTDVKFKKIGAKDLEAEIKGIKVESFDEDIKAATYHEADIKKNKEGLYETNIIFDI